VSEPEETAPPEPEPESRPRPAIPVSRHAVSWKSLLLKSDGGASAWIHIATLFVGVWLLGFIASLVQPMQPGATLGISLCLIPIALCGFIGYLICRQRVIEIVVSDNGLTLAQRGHTTQCEWDEISELYIEEQLRNGVTRYAYCWVIFRDRTKLSLDLSLSDYDTFLQSVQRAVAMTQLSKARQAMKSSEVKFGPVTVGPKGIALNKKWVGWDWVEKTLIGQGHFIIRSREGQNYSCPLKEVPNYLVLFILIHEQLGDERSELLRPA
jgi:hypothetical protein